MLIIAVTGGIGSGKSSVVELFRARGVPVIDTDLIARDVVSDHQVLARLAETFGAQVLNADGRLNRAVLRDIAFASADNRRKLEDLLHPLIYQRATEEISTVDAEYCLLVIPLLYESRQPYQYDRVLVVDVEPQQQLIRTMQRDNASAAEIGKIVAAQATREQRLSMADDIIDNNGAPAELVPQVETLHKKYLDLARKTVTS